VANNPVEAVGGPGWTTTEFGMMVAKAIIGVVVTQGFVSQVQADQFMTQLSALIVAIGYFAMLLANFTAYCKARAAAKAAAAQPITVKIPPT
jgi:outer membrane murein-binding lipoprotein Lpp